MTSADGQPYSSTKSVVLEFDFRHPPEKVWRAPTEPELLAEWLLPVIDAKLEPGAVFAYLAQPQPGWDGVVNCRFVEIEAHRKLSYIWVAGDVDTAITSHSRPRSRVRIYPSCSRVSRPARSANSAAHAMAGR